MTDILSSELKESEGIYYSRDDYAGLMRRMIIFLVDGIVLLVIFLILSTIFSAIFKEDERALYIALILTCLLSAHLYLAVLKSSKIRTLGYILTGVKIVNLKGEKPSFLNMTSRFSLVLLYLTSVFFIIDLIWIWSNKNRQSIRDRFARTYVIKKNALPIGKGNITYANYFLLGWAWSFAEVVRQD